ncbi:protein YgfX [Shigella flexneri]
MVLWQFDSRVSGAHSGFPPLIHRLVSAVILLMPWPPVTPRYGWCYSPLVVFDCVHSERRINARQGEVRSSMDGRLRGKGRKWSIVKAPWMMKSGMMPRLRSDGGNDNIMAGSRQHGRSRWRDYGGLCCNRDAKIKMTAEHMR